MLSLAQNTYRGAQKYIRNVPQPFALTVLSFHKMALAFMRLAPSFERMAHYTPYITFRFNFAIVPVDNLY
jgi:hypothetical protein